MNTKEIIKTVAQGTDMTQKDTRNLLESTVKILKKTLGKRTGFSIPDLGTFSTHTRQKRKSFLPSKKKFAILPPKRVVNFQPSVGLKDEVKDLEVDENE